VAYYFVHSPLNGPLPTRGGSEREIMTPHKKALLSEYFTVGWNVIEGVIAIAAGVYAGSIALIGFGLDSYIEVASGLVLIWRLAQTWVQQR